ncbi:MAG: hypothetical protein ABIR68_06245 [Ilumatobacteraceae bacterium]
MVIVAVIYVPPVLQLANSTVTAAGVLVAVAAVAIGVLALRFCWVAVIANPESLFIRNRLTTTTIARSDIVSFGLGHAPFRAGLTKTVVVTTTTGLAIACAALERGSIDRHREIDELDRWLRGMPST